MKLKCPHCSAEVAIPDGYESDKIVCPACSQSIIIETVLGGVLGGQDDDDELNLSFDDDDESPLDLSDAVEEVAEAGKDKLQQVAEESGLADIAHSAAGFGAGILDGSDDASSEETTEAGDETISLSEALRTPDEELVNKTIDSDDDFGLSLDDDDELQLADADDDSGNVLEDAAEGVADMAGDAVEGASSLVGGAVDGVGDLASGAADMASDAVEGAAEMVDGAIDLTSDAAGAVVDAAGGVLDGAAGLVQGAIDGVSDLAGDAAESIGDAVEAVGDAASPIAGGIAGAAAAAAGAVAGGAFLSGGDDEEDSVEDEAVELLSGDDDDDDFNLDLLGENDESDVTAGDEGVDAFEFESVDDQPLADSDFAAEPAGTFAAGKPDDVEDTDEDGSWLSGELSADDTNLENEDTLLESGTDPVYETEEIEHVEPVRQVDTESEEYENATSSAFDLEETVDYVTPNEDEDAAAPISAVDPFELAQTPESGATASSPTSSYIPGPVPKRRSFLGNMIRGALAAALVLVVSQLVAWWGFGTDPLGVAPKLPLLMQIAVPERLLARTPVVRGGPPKTVQPIGEMDDSGGDDGSSGGGFESGAGDDAGKLAGGDEGNVYDGGGGDGGLATGQDTGFGDVAGTPAETPDETPVNPGDTPDPDGLTGGDRGSSDSADGVPFGDDSPPQDTTNGLAGIDDSGSDTRASDSDTGGLLDDGSSSSDVDSLLADDSPADADLGGADEDLAGLLDMDDDSSVSVGDDPGKALGAVEPPVVEPSSPFDGAGPTNFKPTSFDQLNASIAAAQQASEDFESARLLESKDFGSIARRFYVSHCQLAEAATLVPRQDVVLDGSRKIVENLKSDSTKHSFLANCARGWLSKNNKPTTGVVLAGTINKVSKAGTINRLDVRLMDVRKGTPLNTPVTLVTHLNPTDSELMNYGPGTKVIAFGVRVDDPTANLPGYQGRDGVVVYVTDQMVVIP